MAPAWKDESGWTLPELMLGLVLSLSIAASSLVVLQATLHSQSATGSRLVAQDDGTSAMLRMTKDIRMATAPRQSRTRGRSICCGLAMSQALLGLRKANASWDSTRAHAAAQAGARMALYAINTLGLNGASVTHLPSTLDWSRCAAKAGASAPLGTVAVTVGMGWCDPVPIDLGGGATASYSLSSVINCNAELGWNPVPTMLSLGTIQDCLKRRIVATGTVGGVTRRVYEEARATAMANVVGVLGVNLIGGVTLQLARPAPGTLRECTPRGGTPLDPAIGC